MVYIGPTVGFSVTRPPDELETEFEEKLARIRTAVAALAEFGAPEAVCVIATRVFGVNNVGLLP